MAKQYTEATMIHAERWESFDAFCRDVENRKSRTGGKRAKSVKGNPDWHGVPDIQTAFKFARTGWPQGAALARKMEAQLGPMTGHMESKRKLAMGYVGGAPVIPALLAGSPQHMANPAATAEFPVVTILVNVGMAACVENERYEARGLAIMALVKRLENTGKRVEILAGKFTAGSAVEPNRGAKTRRQGWWGFAVKVKGADEAPDFGKLAYALAHPSMQRVHNFVWLESWALPRDGHGEDWGRTIEAPDCELPPGFQFDMYVTNAMEYSADPLEAYRKLRREAEAAGLLEPAKAAA